MNNPKLSVVIPVYNVEKYLENCVFSILSQIDNDVEIILVDDGSTDSSGVICDKFVQMKKFIKVIHQKNQGLSVARNTGIKNSLGEYILFVDSDDSIYGNTIDKFLQIIRKNKYDIVIGKAKYIKNNGNIVDKANYSLKNTEITGIDYLNHLFQTKGECTLCAQFNIYKREFLVENTLFFKPSIIHEDELWTPVCFLKAKLIYVSDIYFYQHFERTGSIMNGSNNATKTTSLLIVCEELNKIISDYDDDQVKFIKNRIAFLYLKAYVLSNKITMFQRNFPLQNARKTKMKIISVIFLISPKSYKILNQIKNNVKNYYFR